jgi:vacuolar protein sorting-associated protein 35
LETVDFIILNFTEMNKWWVRMQHQGPVRERDKREKERLDLRILVGTNLVRLSQLDGVTLESYKEKVLPRTLEQVVNCKDQIAQEYLMEVIIQVFPDEFHMHTLENFLHTCTELQSGVDVKSIFIAMADRLAKYAQSTPEGIPEQIKIFNTFTKYVAKLIHNQTAMELKDILSLQVALLNFAIKCYPDRLDYVDHVLAFCANLLTKLGGTKKLDKAGVTHVVKLLLLPLDAYKNVLVVLDLANFADLMAFLERPTRKTVALSIVKNMIENNTRVQDVDKVEKLYNFIMPLLKDPAENEPADEVDESDEDFAEEQRYIARLVHLYQNDSTDQLFQMFLISRKFYGKGGTKRIKFTLPSLIFRALQLAIRIQHEAVEGAQVTVKQVFKFIHESLGVLQPHAAEITLRLHLQSAQAADKCGSETIAYEFVTQAFVVYEEELGADSRAQTTALHLIISTLHTLKSFGEDNRDTLMTKAAQYSAKVMKRQDQALAVARVSHLFWGPNDTDNKNSRRCLECLQRALNCAKEAVTSSSSNVVLYVDILNEYLYFFEKQNPEINVKYISGLIALIKSQLEEAQVDDHTRAFFRNTCAHIKLVASSSGENAARYAEIVL